MAVHRTRAATRNTQILACTPHFKDDADNPWVTESQLELGYWFNPKSEVTLEDVAAAVEKFASSKVSRQFQNEEQVPSPITVTGTYIGQVQSFTIRGQLYSRETLVNYRAVEYLHDGEVFNMEYFQTFEGDVKVKLCWCALL